MMIRLLLSCALALVLPVQAAAQIQTFQTIRITSTAADAVCVGGSGVSPASCTGGLKAGPIVVATVDTGQGANELYDMDQNVLTTSNPTFAALTVTTLNTYTFNQSVASGASPTFGAGNITGVLEANITDGSILARLAANETVTGSYTFSGGFASTASAAGTTAGTFTSNGVSGINHPLATFQREGGAVASEIGYEGVGGTIHLWTTTAHSLILGTNSTANLTLASGGAATFNSTLAWGGGSAISSSSNVALLNAANVFTANQQLTSEANAYIGFTDTTDGPAGFIGPAPQIITGGTLDRLGLYGVAGIDFSPDAGASVKMTLSSAGLLTVSGFGTHSFSAGGTGAQLVEIRNTTAGTGNYAGIRLGNDAQANTGALYNLSSTFTTSGPNVANGVVLTAGFAGGLSLLAEHASGDVRVYSRNVLAATFGASQALTLTGAFSVPGLVSLTGTAANLALGSNYLSGDGGDEGISIDSNGIVTASYRLAVTERFTAGAGVIFGGSYTDTTGGTPAPWGSAFCSGSGPSYTRILSNPSSALTVNGLAAACLAPGTFFIVTNISGTYTVTIKHNSGVGSELEILTPTAADIVLSVNDSVGLYVDSDFNVRVVWVST